MVGDRVALGHGSTVGVERVVVRHRGVVGGGDVARRWWHRRTVGVDDPEHGGDRRLGEHRAPDGHVPVADVRSCRRTADLRRICKQASVIKRAARPQPSR